MKHSSATAVNPLYERLFNRFSCSGKTVGEMMLLRAKQENGKSKRDSILDLTAETCITHANLLPRATASEAPHRKAIPAFSARRVNPCSLLALLLFTFICVYLLFAGMRQSLRPFEHGLIETPSAEVQLYAPEIDYSLPS